MNIIGSIILVLCAGNTGEDFRKVLQENCVECHHPGGMAPFALLNHKQAQGWYKAIEEEVVQQKSMPPFGAESPHVTFSNDRSLTADQLEVVKRWVENHNRPESKFDPIVYTPPAVTEEEGITIAFPSIEIPGDNQEHWVFLRGSEIEVKAEGFRWNVPKEKGKKGEKGLSIHHGGLITFPKGSFPDVDFLEGEERMGGYNRLTSSEYFPGNDADYLPKGYATTISPEMVVVAALHFGPQYETMSTEGLEVEILPAQEEDLELPEPILLNFRKIVKMIPPGRYTRTMSIRVERDTYVHSVCVHMHGLGESAQIKIEGKEITVPRWDPNWQMDYKLSEPILVKKGSEIEATLTWNNNTGQFVSYGQFSYEEMGWVLFLITHE